MRVEDRLDEKQIHAGVEHGLGLLVICIDELIETHFAPSRIVGLERDGKLLVGRAQRAGHETRARRISVHGLVRGVLRELHRLDVQIVNQMRQAVVGHRYFLRVEGVGFDDVRAGVEIRLVNFLDDVRLRQHQRLVAILQRLGMVGEILAAVSVLVELVAEHHRPHAAVKDHDAFGKQVQQLARMGGELSD